MKTCRDVHRLVVEGLDRKLPFAERVAVRVHLLMCRTCRQFAAQMDFLRLALRRFRDVMLAEAPDRRPE